MFYEVHWFQKDLEHWPKLTEIQLIKRCLPVPEMQLLWKEMQILLQYISVLTAFLENKLVVFLSC